MPRVVLDTFLKPVVFNCGGFSSRNHIELCPDYRFFIKLYNMLNTGHSGIFLYCYMLLAGGASSGIAKMGFWASLVIPRSQKTKVEKIF